MAQIAGGVWCEFKWLLMTMVSMVTESRQDQDLDCLLAPVNFLTPRPLFFINYNSINSIKFWVTNIGNPCVARVHHKRVAFGTTLAEKDSCTKSNSATNTNSMEVRVFWVV